MKDSASLESIVKFLSFFENSNAPPDFIIFSFIAILICNIINTIINRLKPLFLKKKRKNPIITTQKQNTADTDQPECSQNNIKKSIIIPDQNSLQESSEYSQEYTITTTTETITKTSTTTTIKSKTTSKK